MSSKKIISGLIIFCILFSSAYASDVDDSSTELQNLRTRIDSIQDPISGLPGGVTEPKGKIGYIISKMFNSDGRISNRALKLVGTTPRSTSNNKLLRWSGGNGGHFVDSIIYDTGSKIGIGTTSPQAGLHVAATADLSLSTTTHGFTVGDHGGANIAIDGNEVMARNNGSSSPLYLQEQGGTTSIKGALVHYSSAYDQDFVVYDADKGSVTNVIWYDYSSGRTYLGNQGGTGTNAEVLIRGKGELAVQGTSANHLVTKSYVDNAASSASPWTVSGANIYRSGGNVGIGTTSPSSGLKLDVEGKVGAIEYCDNNGLNCFTPTSGGVASSIDNLTDGASDGFSVFLGGNSGDADDGGNSNVGIGVQSLRYNTSGTHNTAVGRYALRQNTTGVTNTALGYHAMQANTTGNYNNAIGYDALGDNISGGHNNALGYGSLRANTTGHSNNAIGSYALDANTTGIHNNALGSNALGVNTTGHRNNAIGNYSLDANTTGYYNNALGYGSLGANTTGYYNNAIGAFSLRYNTTGHANNAIGAYSIGANTTGSYNNALGNSSLDANTTGSANNALGYAALTDNTTGHSNNAIGYYSLADNTIGGYNNAIGREALRYNTTGSYNSALGSYSLRYNTTGIRNTGLGYGSMAANTTGSDNTAAGIYSLDANTTGYQNTAIGYDALGVVTSGHNNTALGDNAGDNITSGDYNIIIGSDVDAPSATGNNQINIGNTIYGNRANGHVGVGTNGPGLKLEVSTNHGTGHALRLRHQGSGNTYADFVKRPNTYGSPDALSIYNYAGGAWRHGITIDNIGNVGMGTELPTKKLDVAGDINFSGDIYKNGVLVDFAGKFVNGTDPNDAVYTTGNVGIGTADTTDTLTVDGTLFVGVPGSVVKRGVRTSTETSSWGLPPRCGCDTNSNYADCPYDSSTQTSNWSGFTSGVIGYECYDEYESGPSWFSSTYYRVFEVQSITLGVQTALYTDSSQNVGIGTTNPGMKLDVLGDIRGYNVAANCVGAGCGTSTTPPVSGNWTVNGNLHVTGTTTVSTPTSGSHATTKTYVDTAIASAPKGGSVYTHWGNPSCASSQSGITTLDSGYAFNEYYGQTGGSAEASCVVPSDPGATGPGSSYGDLLYNLNTGDAARMPPGISAYKNVKCSKCFVEKPTYLRWGTDSCPAGWSKLYSGYGMGAYYSHVHQSNRKCVDNVNFDASVAYGGHGDIWYGTVMYSPDNTSLYTANRYTQCVVCSKN